MSGQARLDRTGKLSEGGHPLVRELIRLINEERCGISHVAERSGVDRKTIYDWRTQHNPTIDKLEACGNVIGYRLAWVPIDPGDTRREIYDQEAHDALRSGPVTQRRDPKLRGRILSEDGRKVIIRWADGIQSKEDIVNIVAAVFDHARDCPHCGEYDSHIRLHGHTQCHKCGGIISSCCGD